MTISQTIYIIYIPIAGEKKDKGYSAYFPALENAYRVGSVVVGELAETWPRYRDAPPGTMLP